MRYRLLILLIFLLTAIIADAQPIDEAKKKISPALAHINRPNDKLQESVFWISTTDIGSAKNFFRQQAQPVKILFENPHTNLLVVRTTWKMIDSTLIFSPLVRFIE